MGRRIAVTTTDRLTIFQHFGRAESFHIVDIEGKSYTFAEVRHTESACREGGHDETRFDGILDLLSDCEAVVTGKIGPGAAEYLLRRGMRVFEAPGVIEEVLNAIIARHMPEEPGDQPSI
ncbi:MAG: dinitrogenase iron-molybdenum cofactor biosynthesis protein [Clostridiales Family XIII bacterium]|jgi:predicted Fe-Mo cluster-binding NifX family protein|nr:dinitrogenase iron-molybdenum cofactor biosynthesis protein [Clostridiales Family XIII bacterium]